MKVKKCQGEGCQYEGQLWQAKGQLCKSCSMKEKNKNISYAPITEGSYDGSKSMLHIDEIGMMEQPKKKYVKVASTKINVVSEKQAKRLAEYRIVRDRFMQANPFCMVCGAIATDLHHAAGKVGDLLTNVEYFRPLCRRHHEYYETHPLEAKELGISVDRLDK